MKKKNFDTFIPSKMRKSRIQIFKNLDFWGFLTEIQKLLQNNMHTKTHNIVTPNDSLMTKNKLIIEAMKIRGWGGHVTLMKWKPRNKTQMVNPWDHAAKGQLISKCLFGVFNFFQKTNKNMLHSNKNEFICSFFGRIHGLTICFRN